jgi:RimJ/RimL family protein N-acetyltransferase
MRSPPRRPLHTERLVLEPMREQWAEAHWDAIHSSLPELLPWLPWAAGADLEETRRFGAESERAWREGREFDFTVFRDGRVIGGIGLTMVQYEVGIGEIGYWIRSDAAGMGYAVEAARAVVRLGFEDLGLHRLEIRSGTENTRSRRVAERLGFVQEAEGLRQSSRGAAGYYDCTLYSLLASDPRP